MRTTFEYSPIRRTPSILRVFQNKNLLSNARRVQVSRTSKSFQQRKTMNTMKTVLCIRDTANGRCNREVQVPKNQCREPQYCSDHVSRNDVPMSESNGNVFYISKKESSKVEEIRNRVYLDSGIKYLINIKSSNSKWISKWITEEEFYTIPETHKFLVIE